jgi:hypothetical protein
MKAQFHPVSHVPDGSKSGLGSVGSISTYLKVFNSPAHLRSHSVFRGGGLADCCSAHIVPWTAFGVRERQDGRNNNKF